MKPPFLQRNILEQFADACGFLLEGGRRRPPSVFDAANAGDRALYLIRIQSALTILALLLFGFISANRVYADQIKPVSTSAELLNEIDTVLPPTATSKTHTAKAVEPESIWRQFLPMLLTAVALGFAGSIAGLFVLLRKEALIALAIPQAVAVGAAIGMRFGWPTMPPALVAAIVALGYLVNARRKGSSLWVLPSIYVGGLSISFLIIAGKGQELAHLENLFVGIDVAVSSETAKLAVPLLLLVALICASLWRRWLLISQAGPTAELSGLHPGRWDAAFLILLTVVLFMGTSSVGVLLTLAMLFLPAAIVLPFSRRIPQAMFSGCIVSVILLVGSFSISNSMDWPYSQTVGGVGFTLLAGSHLFLITRPH